MPVLLYIFDRKNIIHFILTQRVRKVVIPEFLKRIRRDETGSTRNMRVRMHMRAQIGFLATYDRAHIDEARSRRKHSGGGGVGGVKPSLPPITINPAPRILRLSFPARLF